MVVSVSTNNQTQKTLFSFIFIFILFSTKTTLLPCQARLLELNSKITTSSSLPCEGDINLCEANCETLNGCRFTCIDDVGFYCLCHCDGESERFVETPRDVSSLAAMR
ncbi:hypothetical protein SOVF_113330 [Spinacia oleracea]|nr:hypothetical protein SOVF_113330 [Spinacia oleracea]